MNNVILSTSQYCLRMTFRKRAWWRENDITAKERKEQRILVICSEFPGRKTTLGGSLGHLLSVGTVSHKDKPLYTL